MAQINKFEVSPLWCNGDQLVAPLQASLQMAGTYIPGTLPFNNVMVVISGAVQTIVGSLTLSFGLYSLTGASLTLVNSASMTTSNALTGFYSWCSMVTSATSNIPPGNWYFGILVSTAVTTGMQLFCVDNTQPPTNSTMQPGGLLVRGVLSVSTAGLPTSVLTSSFLKEGATLTIYGSSPASIIISA